MEVEINKFIIRKINGEMNWGVHALGLNLDTLHHRRFYDSRQVMPDVQVHKSNQIHNLSSFFS